MSGKQPKPQPNKHISIKTLDGLTGESAASATAAATWVATFFPTAATKFRWRGGLELCQLSDWALETGNWKLRVWACVHLFALQCGSLKALHSDSKQHEKDSKIEDVHIIYRALVGMTLFANIVSSDQLRDKNRHLKFAVDIY